MAAKGIIFDLDGVIVFTDKYHYKAWKALAESRGIYFDEVINQRLRGVSRMDSLEIILERYAGPALTEDEKEEMAAEKNEIYKGYLAEMTPADVEESVRETLKALREKGYLLALGSSSKNAGFILQQTGITDLFDAVSDGNNISMSKPDPEVFLKAAEFLNLDPGSCAVVEDADAGIAAAKAAGMTSIAIGKAVSEQSDYRIDQFAELREIFK